MSDCCELRRTFNSLLNLTAASEEEENVVRVDDKQWIPLSAVRIIRQSNRNEQSMLSGKGRWVGRGKWHGQRSRFYGRYLNGGSGEP